MAFDQIEMVVGRLVRDRNFRVQYCRNPDAALESYLPPEAIRAVKSGDGHGLSIMGHERWDELFASLCDDVPCD